MNWKTPQKRKSVPRILSMSVATKLDISNWFPCGADGQTDVRSRDYQNFSDG